MTTLIYRKGVLVSDRLGIDIRTGETKEVRKIFSFVGSGITFDSSLIIALGIYGDTRTHILDDMQATASSENSTLRQLLRSENNDPLKLFTTYLAMNNSIKDTGIILITVDRIYVIHVSEGEGKVLLNTAQNDYILVGLGSGWEAILNARPHAVWRMSASELMEEACHLDPNSGMGTDTILCV